MAKDKHAHCGYCGAGFEQLTWPRECVGCGELTWRIGLPISALILSLLAIPLSFVNPRGGRSLNLILALLIYLVYSNCMSMVQAWVVQGRIGAFAGILGVHSAMLLLLAVLFYRRVSVFSLRRRFA